jgi:hypothetical protein
MRVAYLVSLQSRSNSSNSDVCGYYIEFQQPDRIQFYGMPALLNESADFVTAPSISVLLLYPEASWRVSLGLNTPAQDEAVYCSNRGWEDEVETFLLSMATNFSYDSMEGVRF